MVVSVLNGCSSMASAGALLKQSELDSGMHWRQSPQATSLDNNQQNCLVDFSNNSHRSPQSPIQNTEENSFYDSENGADNSMSSPQQEASRSSGSEDNTASAHLFPISSINNSNNNIMMGPQCMESYSNSENESSQASPISFNEEEGFRTTTKSGTNGKVKIHKCRSCGFSTTNKHESWLHIAIHMKPDKILKCPDCPFVTEYKHHLDFHVWNHQGMKPYKCDKCPYVCVNKSMLKSHLKSHSNVYQYRCANCAYRTKYCHSLKIHLRKYRHEPGVVLDSEGNPNPNPVIDVYGNRRGPKQKPKKGQSTATSLTQQQSIPAQLSPFPNFPWVNNIFFAAENSKLRCPTIVPPILNAAYMNEHSSLPELPLQIELHSNDSKNLCLSNNNNNDNSQLNLQSFLGKERSSLWMKNDVIFDQKLTSDSGEYNSNNKIITSPPPTVPMYLFDRINQNSIAISPFDRSDNSPFQRSLNISPNDDEFLHNTAEKNSLENLSKSNERGEDCVPLNLSLWQSSKSTTDVPNEKKSMASSMMTPSITTTTTTGQTAKNRRKGIACKLKRCYTSEDEEELLIPKNFTISPTENDDLVTKQPKREQEDSSSEDNELVSKMKSKKSHFYCGYCEITFFNQVMFTMHMGYHGYSDPFTCNRCGEKTEDNIAFYAHMISSAHV